MVRLPFFAHYRNYVCDPLSAFDEVLGRVQGEGGHLQPDDIYDSGARYPGQFQAGAGSAGLLAVAAEYDALRVRDDGADDDVDRAGGLWFRPVSIPGQQPPVRSRGVDDPDPDEHAHGADVSALQKLRCAGTGPVVHGEGGCQPPEQLLAVRHYVGHGDGAQGGIVHLYLPPVFPGSAEGDRGSGADRRGRRHQNLLHDHAAERDSALDHRDAVLVRVAV
ncbi:hypothetical protein D1872_228630 [compost metagenome]